MVRTGVGSGPPIELFNRLIKLVPMPPTSQPETIASAREALIHAAIDAFGRDGFDVGVRLVLDPLLALGLAVGRFLGRSSLSTGVLHDCGRCRQNGPPRGIEL